MSVSYTPAPFALFVLLGIAGCYGAETDQDDFTHTTADVAPPDDAPVGVQQGNSNTTVTPQMGPQGFTMSWQINPNECLQPYGVNGTTNLTTARCNGSLVQRWRWSGGKFINVSTGGCLDMFNANPGATVVVAACSSSSTTQSWFTMTNNQFYQTLNGNNYMIAPTSQGTGDGINFSMALQAPADATREWILSVNAPATTQTGYTMVFVSNPNMCLTNSASGPLLQACGTVPAQQLWNYESGLISQGSQCLTVSGSVLVMAACDGSQTAQLWWLGTSADIVTQTNTAAPTCLFAQSSGKLTLVPNSTANRAWTFGSRALN